MYVRRIPEHPGAGRLGRHVRHDPRSLRYLYPAREVSGLVSVRHQRYIPVLDQGDLGSWRKSLAKTHVQRFSGGGFPSSLPPSWVPT